MMIQIMTATTLKTATNKHKLKTTCKIKLFAGGFFDNLKCGNITFIKGGHPCLPIKNLLAKRLPINRPWH